MRPEMARAAAAIQEARKLIDRPRGRFPVVYSKDYISTKLTGLQDARMAAQLLSYDARFRAESGDLDGALVACRALVNCVRSIGDEPALIAQLVRIAFRFMAIVQAERTLGLGEPSGAPLLALQEAMEAEAEEPLFQIAIRGERAGMDRFMEALQRGDLTVPRMKRVSGGAVSQPKLAFGEEQLLYLPGVVTNSRAQVLERMNQLVKISQLPAEERAAPLAALKASLGKDAMLRASCCRRRKKRWRRSGARKPCSAAQRQGWPSSAIATSTATGRRA